MRFAASESGPFQVSCLVVRTVFSRKQSRPCKQPALMLMPAAYHPQTPGFHPTRRNMWEQIQWLVQGAQPGDSLFFSFSGAVTSPTRFDIRCIVGSMESAVNSLWHG